MTQNILLKMPNYAKAIFEWLLRLEYNATYLKNAQKGQKLIKKYIKNLENF